MRRQTVTSLFAILLFAAAAAAGAQSSAEDQLFREAEDHYRTGNTLLALERFEDFARLYPLSDRMPDAQYRIGVCQYRLGRYSEAVDTFRRVESRYATTRYIDLVYFWAGMASYHLGKWGDAIAAFERFEGRLDDPETGAQALLYRALSEAALGDNAAAIRSLKRLVDAYPASPLKPQALLRQMDLGLRSGDAAAVLAIDVAGLAPEWQAQGRLYRAEALWRLDRRQEAQPLYESLRGEAPALATLAYQRLFALAQARGDLAGMESLAQEAEQRLGGDPGLLADLWLRVGAESLQRNELDSAGYFLRRAWDRGAEAPAGDGSARHDEALYLAEVHIRAGRLDDAAAVLSAEAAGKGTDVTLRLADVRLMQGRFADAAALYERAAAASQPAGSDEPSLLLAYCRYRLGDNAAALAITTRLLASGGAQGGAKPLRVETLRLHAAILAAQGSLEQAAAALSDLVAASPSDGRAALDLMRLQFRRGEYQRVVQQAATRLSAPPAKGAGDPYARVVALYLKGLSETALKRYADALVSLDAITPAETAAAGLSVIDPYVLYYRAWARYRRGDLAGSRDLLSSLLDKYPSHALRQEALYLAGWCLFSLSDHNKALPYFKEVAESTGPRADRAALLYGKSLAALGRNAEALAVFQKLGQKPGDVAGEARFEAAGTLAALGRVDEAAAAYRDLAAAYPSSPLAEEALYRRGTLFREARRPADAAAAFTDYRTRFPEGRQMDGALYWGGLSSQEDGHAFGAVLLWEILIDRYRTSSFRADALRRTAAIYEQRNETGRSLAMLERLAADYPDQAASVRDKIRELRLVQAGASDREAQLRVRVDGAGGAKTAAGRAAMLDLAALDVHETTTRGVDARARALDEADRLLSSVLASGDAALAPRAHYLLAEVRDARGNPVEAAREFLAAAVAAPGDADLAPSALYRAAEAMSRAGKREDTRALVDRLERSFPGSSWTLEARKLLEVSR